MSSRRTTAVIPTFNRKAYLARALRSILNQDVQVDEIVVVDDGSTDGTADMLRSDFPQVRTIGQPNSGVSAARQKGVEAATGDWIAFLDSDDLWTPGRMRSLSNAIDAAPADVDWIFGDTRIVQDGGQGPTLFAEYGLEVIGDPTVLDDPLVSQFPFQFSLLQSSIIRRTALLAAGGFSEGLRSSEDFLLGFRMAVSGRMAATPTIVTELYRTSDLAASSLDGGGRRKPDYYRARVLAFDAAIAAGCAGPWRARREDAIRGWCLALHAAGEAVGWLPWRQLQGGSSPKALAFILASLGGRTGIDLWNRLSSRRRRTDQRFVLGHGAKHTSQPFQ